MFGDIAHALGTATAERQPSTGDINRRRLPRLSTSPPERGDRSTDPPPPTAGRPSPAKKRATSTVEPKAAAPGDHVSREKPRSSPCTSERQGEWRRSWPGRRPPPAPASVLRERADGRRGGAPREVWPPPPITLQARPAALCVEAAVPARQRGEAAAAAMPRGLCPAALPPKWTSTCPGGVLLSSGGRVVLLNAVLDALPTFAMGTLDLPPALLRAIDALRRAFLWNVLGRATDAKCLVAWDAVCRPKREDGLGIKCLTTKNECLQFKLVHHLHSDVLSMWPRWAWSAAAGHAVPGQHWKHHQALMPLYRSISVAKVGDG
ncbi:hypothetical protein QYE76_060164 [Lolium multiflorum]|uniref:Uncharacterized protein n=1 Tax=Lolium multiflorum TaxID=4521 RepID=A0AAD8RYI2_LOLMU|nr:hypothetical protein QYE76_060164 [Lolium multiflorum]